MRQRRKTGITASLILAIFTTLLTPLSCNADEVSTHPHYTEAIYSGELEKAGVKPKKILTTAYCQGTTTATGAKVRRGICAGRREDIGKTVIAYYVAEDGSVGDFLGIWEILDTGFGADSDGDGIGSIEEGKVLDMYFPTLEECRLYMKDTGGHIYVQIVDGKG